MKFDKRHCCCACGARYLQAPYHVLPNEALVCSDCCDRIAMILRGIVIKIQEDGPTVKAR